MTTNRQGPKVLRRRDGREARVTFEELFFDLVYVFAVTQVSHFLLAHLTPLGALQSLVLWFGVWLGWQYTTWMTNWFDPHAVPVRVMLFVVMALGLAMSSSLPGAFGASGLAFAIGIASIQVGRSLYIVALLPRHELTPNFVRILGWNCISGSLWIAGGLSTPDVRLWWWIGAVACDYASPMIGFRLPGLGRSQTSDWTIEGGHFAERCQLFVMVALGESILLIGETFAHSESLASLQTLGFVSGFVGCIAMWWLYFDTSSEDGSHVIAHSADPGQLASWFGYVHVLIVGAIVVTAVGNELVIAHPHGALDAAALIVNIGAPVAYFAANGLYKRVVYGAFPLSHLAGVVLVMAMWPLAGVLDLLSIHLATTVITLGVAWRDSRQRHRSPLRPVARSGRAAP